MHANPRRPRSSRYVSVFLLQSAAFWMHADFNIAHGVGCGLHTCLHELSDVLSMCMASDSNPQYQTPVVEPDLSHQPPLELKSSDNAVCLHSYSIPACVQLLP